MTWRLLADPDVAAYPARLEVRSLTMGEWHSLEQMPTDAAKQGYILEQAARIDGAPAAGCDMHVGIALIRGVMANPWCGTSRTASNTC